MTYDFVVKGRRAVFTEDWTLVFRQLVSGQMSPDKLRYVPVFTDVDDVQLRLSLIGELLQQFDQQRQQVTAAQVGGSGTAMN